MEEVKRDLESDYSSRPIKTLCTTDKKGNVLFLSCKPALPLESMRSQYKTMAGANSEVFQKIWRKKLTSLTKRTISTNDNTDVSFEAVVEHLWEPAFQECKVLIETLNNRTIQLSEVKSYFFEYCEDGNDQNLTCKLVSFYSSVEMCINKCRPTECPPWLKMTIQLMLKYWKLRHDIQAAEVILEAKEQLKVTGDFSLIRNLATKVYTITS